MGRAVLLALGLLFLGDEASRMTLANPASPFAASDLGLTLTCAGPL